MTTSNKPISMPIYNINDVFLSYSMIPIGEYNNDKIRVNVSIPGKDYRRIEINSSEYNFLIRFFDYGYDVVYNNKKDTEMKKYDYSLNIVKALDSKTKFIKFIKDNKKYNIFNGLVRVDGEEYKIKDNIISKNIDKNSFIEYDLNENNIFLYISIKKGSINKEKDYFKFGLSVEDITRELHVIQNYLKNNNLVGDSLLIDIIDSITKKDLILIKKELIDVSNIYNDFYDKLNVDSRVIDEIGLFGTYLYRNPVNARINRLKNHITNTDITDTRELKYIKTEVTSLLKEKKKEKKKILK